MKTVLKLTVMIPILLLGGCWDEEPSQDAKENAETIADGMRTIRDATNAKGEDRLDNKEIAQFENTLALLGDEDNRKSMKCGVVIMEVQNLISRENLIEFQYKSAENMEAIGVRLGDPEIIEAGKEAKVDAKESEKDYRRELDEIVKGSLLDWLFQMGLKSLDTFGQDGNNQAYKALHHECMQKSYDVVMNPYDKMPRH